jgi:hypothetical protein
MTEETYDELEKRKLQAEIKNLKRRPLNTPGFWAPLFTLGIALITYAYFWQSGVFDEKLAHINYVNDTLTQKSKRLDNLVKSQEEFATELGVRKRGLDEEIKNLEFVRKNVRGSISEQQKRIADLILENNQLKSNLKDISAVANNPNPNFFKEGYERYENRVRTLKSAIGIFSYEWSKIDEQIHKEEPPIVYSKIISFSKKVDNLVFEARQLP